jgi:ABC-type glycerol-3-phosphate transport system permease component
MTAAQATSVAAAPTEPRTVRRRFRRPSVGAVIVYVAATLLAVFWLLPLLWALSTSFKTETEASLGQDIHWWPQTWSVEGYKVLFERGDHFTWMLNSTIVSVIVTVLTLVLCVTAAYGFSRFEFPAKNVLFGAIIAAVAIFTFIGSWNNYLWPLLVASDPSMMTLPVGLQVVAGGYGLFYAQNMAAAVLGAAPLLIVFLIFQKRIVEGVAGVGLK